VSAPSDGCASWRRQQYLAASLDHKTPSNASLARRPDPRRLVPGGYLDDDGEIRRVEVAHADQARAACGRAAQYPQIVGPTRGLPR
jgi:hypothetical protein